MSGQLGAPEIQKLKVKSIEISQQINDITVMMKRNQLTDLEYMKVLSELLEMYQSNVQSSVQNGDRRRQQLFTLKRDIVSREVSQSVMIHLWSYY